MFRLEFRKEPADDNPPVDDDEQDRRLPGCTPQATGIRFEDMGLAVRVAVSGEAASEEERIQPERRWRNFATPRCSNS